MLRITLALAAAAALQACSLGDRGVYFGDGSRGHLVECRGFMYSPGDCAARAGDVCGQRGYTLVDQSGTPLNPQPRFITLRTVYVKCKT